MPPISDAAKRLLNTLSGFPIVNGYERPVTSSKAIKPEMNVRPKNA